MVTIDLLFQKKKKTRNPSNSVTKLKQAFASIKSTISD